MKGVTDGRGHVQEAVSLQHIIRFGGDQEWVVEGRNRYLLVGKVELWDHRSCDFVLDRIRRHPDDGVRLNHPHLFAPETDLLADGVLTRKVSLRESLVDQRGIWR